MEQELPSNKKFGFFFAFVFSAFAAYFYLNAHMVLTTIFVAISLIFFIVSWIREDFLSPLNKLWMDIGVLFGMFVSPIVMAAIFFTLFTPTAIIMRLIGRDELKLKSRKSSSYWILRTEPIKPKSFNNQF